ncbi:MAG TPA: adenylate/guanylate cyclase domain-containing protein [Pyrinomonadaceae bacterium]|nr:adenylate/guanylate cyclase domain-containing protein [Pyrinomonadaceae bacterium]
MAKKESREARQSFVSVLLRRHYWLAAALLTLVVWAVVALAMRPLKDADGSNTSHPYGLTTGLENQSLDLLFQLRDARRPELRQRGQQEPLTIIEIDDATIKASGVRIQKWPRDLYARLIDSAAQGGAAVIGLDMFLSEAGGASADDKAADEKLAKSIAEAGNVVVAMKTAAGGFEELQPLPMFADGAYAVGYVDLPLDSDEFVRSSQLVIPSQPEEKQLSFATRLVEGYLTATAAEGSPPAILQKGANGNFRLGEREILRRNDGNLQLDFRGRSPAFRRVSAAAILFNPASVPPDSFRDRIVLIGASNIDAPDLFATPFYEYSALARLFDRSLPNTPKRMPGVELHANAAATLLHGKMLKRPRYLLQTLATLLALIAVAASVFWLRPLIAFIAVIVIAGLSLAISSWAFNAHGIILPLASTWLGMIALTPIGLGVRYARERLLRSETEAERAQVMDIFSRFVSADVAKEMWDRRGQSSLAGEIRTVTIIFTDIRNFTTLSESEASDKVVAWLNDYFGRMNEIVERYGGHINKYIGDGLMIVFGAPVDRGDRVEAKAAVECGLAMLDEVERMNEDWKGSGRPVVKIGVGIHTGLATCGVVGAERRLEYTVIGDTVNLSARLESTTKEFSVPILISEPTAKLVGDYFDIRPLGEVKVKGKTQNTTVFTVSRKAIGSNSGA